MVELRLVVENAIDDTSGGTIDWWKWEYDKSWVACGQTVN